MSACLIDLSVVIPVYNSAPTIHTLLARLVNTLEKVTNAYEIILVDDGSQDQSWQVMEQLQALHKRSLVVVQLMRNYGQHNALMCGLGIAKGKYIITMDDDLQNPPEEIPKILQYIQNHNLDLVYGQPSTRNHSTWRNLGSKMVWRFHCIVFRHNISPTPFRILKHQVARSILFYNLNYTYLDGLLAWCTTRIGSVDVEHHARLQGRSGYSIRKLVELAFNLCANFSLIPLRLVSILGFMTAGCGFMASFYYFIQYIWNNISIPGYSSTIIAILILGGAQLLALGVIGEYIGRTHLNVNRKPQYLIRNIIHQEITQDSTPGHCEANHPTHA